MVFLQFCSRSVTLYKKIILTNNAYGIIYYDKYPRTKGSTLKDLFLEVLNEVKYYL